MGSAAGSSRASSTRRAKPTKGKGGGKSRKKTTSAKSRRKSSGLAERVGAAIGRNVRNTALSTAERARSSNQRGARRR